MEEKIEYRMDITRIVNGKREAGSMKFYNDLDEVISDIDQFVDRMRPLKPNNADDDEMLENISEEINKLDEYKLIKELGIEICDAIKSKLEKHEIINKN